MLKPYPKRKTGVSRTVEGTREKAAGQLTWRTVAPFARAVSHFSAAKNVRISSSSLDLLQAENAAPLPPACDFRSEDGFRLAYRRYESLGARYALVLIHGAGCFGDQMHEVARRVAQQGLACAYTLDMRGHGLSDGRRGHAVADPSELVNDIEAFVRSIKADTGASVIVCGHSAGGGLALAFSRSMSARLASGYVFFAPFLGLGSMVDRPQFGGWVRLRPWMLRAVAAANLVGIKRFNDTTVLDFDAGLCGRESRCVTSWSFATMLGFGPGGWVADAAPIPAATPVLVLAGAEDECFDQSRYAEAFEVVAPHAKLPAVGPCGHWDILVDPAALQELERWLGELPADCPCRDRPSPPIRPLPMTLDAWSAIKAKVLGVTTSLP